MMSRNRPAVASDTIPGIARSVLQDTVSCYDKGDKVIVEAGRRGVRVAYHSVRLSRSARDVTRLEIHLDFRRRQMWVDDLRIAPALQSNGIGRQLVAAVERIALACGLRTVRVFPLMSARHFWSKMGYTSDLRTARVVTKELTPACALVTADGKNTRDSTA